jgi:hypothetical protein
MANSYAILAATGILMTGCGSHDIESSDAQVALQMEFFSGLPMFLGEDPNAFYCAKGTMVIDAKGAISLSYNCRGNTAASGGSRPVVTAQLDAASLEEHKLQILRADPFSLEDDYGDDNLQDCDARELTLYINGHRKDIAVHCGLLNVPPKGAQLFDYLTGLAPNRTEK